ncbi:MAG: aminodeoxychorismate synthase component I [Deltaproteobacteria bacterium]|nr:aminodeoxychorismate synthase component I [Deltaproteobacteria bacterium]
MSVKEIPYCDPCSIFPLFKDQPFSILLDSCGLGRYSLIVFEPKEVIRENPFPLLKKYLKTNHQDKNLNFPLGESPLGESPFSGGWVGYLGYDLYPLLETRIPQPMPQKDSLPPCLLGYYDKGICFDHLQKKMFVFSENHESQITEILKTAPSPSMGEGQGEGDRGVTLPFIPSHQGRGDKIDFLSNFTHEEYLRAIRKIKDYIAAGDCYQVNLSQRFQTKYGGDPWDLYLRLREVSPSPYAAYLNGGDFQILSSSPELFLRVRADGGAPLLVTTRPIKGTRPRGKTPEEDARLKEELVMSRKDRAELLMITDLERNDLGRVCKKGSIQVSELYRAESFSNVHHLVATIEGELEEGKDAVDCLKACFPGGSITGAPKIRAMEIIRELETVPRGVYTGAIGFIGDDQSAHFNIAIRTLTLKEGNAFFHSGGGIVADSDPEAEYQETLAKASGIMRALDR